MKIVSFRQLRHYWPIYLLVLPAVTLTLIFSYYPAISAMYHAFFRWNGDDISEFVGLRNFARAFDDEILGSSFILVMILVVANLFKMIPSIITAVLIHRLRHAGSRYMYRVLFVIPMIIPMMVWMLIWKYFYNPRIGVFNRFLNATGLMSGLNWLDNAMPALSEAIAPTHDKLINPVFGSVWGMALFGLLLICLIRGGVKGLLRTWMIWLGLLFAGYYAWGGPIHGAILLFGAIAAVSLLRRCSTQNYEKIKTAGTWVGGIIIVAAIAIVCTSMIWTHSTGTFAGSRPAWLGQKDLIVPALIFWGFPWVGVVSVLLYLSGLGNIDQSIYDAADIDGCGWFRKFWSIELPLIMTQVRLNLVLMIIYTLKGWGLVYILLGDSGGPGGAGMVPGLYMFRKAFRDMEVGYACGIGLLLFGLILFLTLINNRYVRVEK